MSEASPGRVIGRYALFDVLASGGMATVHIGRLLGPVGFARTVAIKRLHPQFARDPEFVAMFLDEARMCARIRHPNVVPTIDVVATSGELFLVMEYVQGEALSQLIRTVGKQGKSVPWRVAVAILAGSLQGLHAAHESTDERGLPLGLVHRDISPQNILVGVDGMARVVDFGIAKATGRLQTTRAGAVKGKLGYMAPEQMAAEGVTRQSDVYAAGVVLWELLTGKRLFDGDSETIVLARVLTHPVPAPSTIVPDIPKEVDAVVMRAVSRKVSDRYSTAREFAAALEKLGPAPLGEVGDWVQVLADASLAERARRVAEVETGSGLLTPVPTPDVAPSGTTPEPPSGRRSASAIAPAVVQTARSGSIRPTAKSEPGAVTEAPARAEKKPPNWLVSGAVAGLILVGYGIYLAASTRSDPIPVAPSAAANPVSLTPPGGDATAFGAPTEIANAGVPLNEIAVDADGIFVLDRLGGRLLRFDDQGSMRTLISTLESPRGIALDSGRVYSTTGSVAAGECRVVAVPKAGGAPVVLLHPPNAGGKNCFHAVAVGNGQLVASRSADVQRGSTSTPSDVGTTIGFAIAPPLSAVTAAVDYVYWVDPGGAVLRSAGAAVSGMTPPGNEVGLVSTGLSSPVDIVERAGLLYVATSVSVAKVSANATNAALTVLTPDVTAPYGISVDGTHAYWADTAGRIRAIPLSGGRATTLWKAPAQPFDTATRGDAIFVTTAAGGVHKITKN